jgi:hypothetical protein
MASSNTRTLVLPNGGTMEIPLPGSDARFAMRPAGVLAAAEACPALAPTILIGIVLGVAVGVAATAFYLRKR